MHVRWPRSYADSIMYGLNLPSVCSDDILPQACPTPGGTEWHIISAVMSWWLELYNMREWRGCWIDLIVIATDRSCMVWFPTTVSLLLSMFLHMAVILPILHSQQSTAYFSYKLITSIVLILKVIINIGNISPFKTYTMEPLYKGHLWGPTFRPL